MITAPVQDPNQEFSIFWQWPSSTQPGLRHELSAVADSADTETNTAPLDSTKRQAIEAPTTESQKPLKDGDHRATMSRSSPWDFFYDPDADLGPRSPGLEGVRLPENRERAEKGPGFDEASRDDVITQRDGVEPTVGGMYDPITGRYQ